MSLGRSKTIRAQYKSSIGYTQIFVVIFGLGLMCFGLLSYLLPEFFVVDEYFAIGFAAVGGFIFFLGLIPPLIEVLQISQTASYFVAMFVIVLIVVIMFMLTGQFEIPLVDLPWD